MWELQGYAAVDNGDIQAGLGSLVSVGTLEEMYDSDWHAPGSGTSSQLYYPALDASRDSQI
jgi:hypothetical protein